MGPLPKRRISKSRRGKRRAHDALKTPHIIFDEETGEYRVSHRVGKKSGMYKGRQVTEGEDEI